MFDTSKNIVKTDQKAEATADLGMVGKGSSECASQAGTFDTSKNIVKTDQQARRPPATAASPRPRPPPPTPRPSLRQAAPTAEISKMGLGSSEGASQSGDTHGHNTIVKPQARPPHRTRRPRHANTAHAPDPAARPPCTRARHRQGD